MIRSCRCFSLGQHRALLAVNARLIEGESLFAFLDDLYVLCSPERVGEVPQSDTAGVVSGQHSSASRKDESLEQGRCRATWIRRVDSRSKDGQGQCHSVGWEPKFSFCSAGHASVGVTNWTPGFCEIDLGEVDCRTFRSFGAHSSSPRFAISMVAVVVLRCPPIQFLASHSAARIG